MKSSEKVERLVEGCNFGVHLYDGTTKDNFRWSRLKSHQYLTNVQCCYRQFGSETIHSTHKFTSMNLL